ncbi:unnamed protein product, partial [Meganyctiphanes norvegica]
MDCDNEESITPNESDYPKKVLRKSLYGNSEVNVKEEIVLKEEPMNIKGIEIKLAKETGTYNEPIAFTWESNLLKHELTHTMEKSYKCTFCDKQFSQNCLLIKHQIVHSGEKTYQCSLCD